VERHETGICVAALISHAWLCPVDSILKFAGLKGLRNMSEAYCASTFVDTHSFDIFKTPDISVILERIALL